MTLFAFASCHGSPGVTATAMGLGAVWRATTGREVLIIEADPDGGVLASRFDELRADTTLADVAVDVRRAFDIDAVLGSAREVWGGVAVVVSPPSAEHTHSALSAAGDRFAAGLAAADALDVLVDVGRLTARSPALHLARRAVASVFVTRPTFEGAASLAARLPELAAHGIDPAVVLVGDQPYGAADFERAVGAPILGVVAHDPRAAAVFAGGAGSERHVRRSLLRRSLVEVASRLVALVPTPVEDPSEMRDPAGDVALGQSHVGVES